MKDWIKIETDGLMKLTEQDVNHSSAPSPYDIPQAVCREYDPTNDRLVLEFEYIGEEPIKSQGITNGVVCFHVGKHSGRIFQIAVPQATKGDKVAAKIKDAVNQLQRENPSTPADRYNLTNTVISNSRQDLFEGLLSLEDVAVK